MTDPVLVVLGGAVVKAAVRLWIGPSVLADELTADLGDLLQSRVSDDLERRKLRRRFEEMEDIVAGQVLAVMKNEFRGIDEGERNAAVAAVTGTFGRARVTSKELFSADLDPLNLERYIRRFTGDATRDLSWGGTQLYDRVLALCCAYILEIADKLPRFQAGAFGELLRRDSQILARLEDVLERLPAPSSDRSASDRVDTAYRQRIANAFDRLELFGLDFAAQWYELSIAYVNLHLSRQAPVEGGFGSLGVPFEDWLAEYPRLLLEGRAGGGKTTILQWIAVRAARRDFTGSASAFNGHIPFFIRLREYVGKPLPAPEDFLNSVAPRLLSREELSWPREQLQSGRAFLLIDGVDEIPEAQRPAVLSWVQELTEYFPDTRCVITTRPAALKSGALADAGFVKVDLEPMNPALVRVFIDRWHDAIAQWQVDAESTARLAVQHDQLIQILGNDRFLGELANTPLLAGLICALNQHLDGQLPRRRGEIFEKALAMFHERDRKRGIASDLTLDLDATNHLLGDLALWMVRNRLIEVAADSSHLPGDLQRRMAVWNARSEGAADRTRDGGIQGLVAADAARNIFRQSALSLPNRPARGADLYAHLLLRSGVLREPTAGYIDFVHRTFQEYLAARALIMTDSVNEIISHGNDDQWREVIILASGQGNRRQTTDLLRGMLHADRRSKGLYRSRLLAVACLDEIRSAEGSVLAEIEHVIPELLPPRDMAQAEALSHAGERLIPHLAKVVVKFPLSVLRPSIRAAALIGGPEALRLISKIASRQDLLTDQASTISESDRRALLEEMERAWAYFDPDEYTERVLRHLSPVSLTISDTRRLASITGLSSLEELRLNYFVEDDIDLSVLGTIPISRLAIIECELTTLAGSIRNWPSIVKLELVSCYKLTNVTSISKLRNLQDLTITRCPFVSDYSSVAHLSYLECVSLPDQQIPDFYNLRALPLLRTVKVNGNSVVNLCGLDGKNVEVYVDRDARVTMPDDPSGVIIHRT